MCEAHKLAAIAVVDILFSCDGTRYFLCAGVRLDSAPLFSRKNAHWMGRGGLSLVPSVRLSLLLCVLFFLSVWLYQALISLLKCSSFCEKNDLAWPGLCVSSSETRFLERKRIVPSLASYMFDWFFNFSKPQPTPKFVSPNFHIRRLCARGIFSEHSYLGRRAQNIHT